MEFLCGMIFGAVGICVLCYVLSEMAPYPDLNNYSRDDD